MEEGSGGYLPEDPVLAPDAKRLHGYTLKVSQDGKDSGKKLLEQTSQWTPLTRTFDRDWNTRRRGKAKFKRALPASQLFSAMPPLEAVKVFASIMMSIGWSYKRKPLKLRHYDISRAHVQKTAQRHICVFQRKIDRNMAKTQLAS